jgi:hypothetical protein
MAENGNGPTQKHQDEEEHLFQLIKQAGEAARERKKKAMAQHVEKLQLVISEAISRKNNLVSI